MNKNNPQLTLIYGPMFSGKTTKLIELYNVSVSNYGQEKCLAFNYKLDTRYGMNQIITHDGKKINCISIINIDDFITNELTRPLILNAQYIFINEAQFFENIDKTVLHLHNILKKDVILCGIDLDYKRNKFGCMMNLLSSATNVLKLSGTCKLCAGASEFSHRTVPNSLQILIGYTQYIPLCEKCYNTENGLP
jgi:thymidine kinase